MMVMMTMKMMRQPGMAVMTMDIRMDRVTSIETDIIHGKLFDLEVGA